MVVDAVFAHPDLSVLGPSSLYFPETLSSAAYRYFSEDCPGRAWSPHPPSAFSCQSHLSSEDPDHRAPPLFQQEHTHSVAHPTPKSPVDGTESSPHLNLAFIGLPHSFTSWFLLQNFCNKYLHQILISRSPSVASQPKMEAYQASKGKKQKNRKSSQLQR